MDKLGIEIGIVNRRALQKIEKLTKGMNHTPLDKEK